VEVANWSLTSLQQLVKTRDLRIKHARYYWLLLAESHLTRLFGSMLTRSRRCRHQRDRRSTERSKFGHAWKGEEQVSENSAGKQPILDVSV
jgi:hypothetical protein